MSFVPPVDTLNAGAATSWGNLGDWSEATRYPAAAEALARRLGRSAGLGPGQRVVDVGCGAGDQLGLWVRDFAVEEVRALEPAEELAEKARHKVKAWGLTRRISVESAGAEGLRADSDSADCVLALDSAYVFPSRMDFLRRARVVLRPGGALALSDLTLGTGIPARLVRTLAPLCGIPRRNLLTPGDWMATLEAAGFSDVELEDCTDEVLAGFARWVATPGLRPGAALTGFGWTLGRLSGLGGIGYAILTARATSA